MNKFFRGLILGVCALAFSCAAMAKASEADAIALVKKAAALVKSDGKEKAFAEFNNQKGSYVVNELYVMAFDYQGNTLAHGGNNRLIGKNILDTQDSDGVYLIKGLINVAKSGQPGWFSYRWPNSVTHAVEAKSTYVIPMDGYLLGVGIYK